MLQMLVITMREGIEAFLIVAITAAYLRKTGRRALLPAVWWGVGTAVLLSVAASLLFQRAENKPLWEGLLAGAAGIMVASMVIYMRRVARRLKNDIGVKIEEAAAKPGVGALIGVFTFTLFMIVREGMETALLIGALLFQSGSKHFFAGAIVGLCLAASLAWAWSRFGHRIDLGRFFQVTAVFLMIFVVQLVIYSFHEFTEARILPIDNDYWHITTEPYGPDGVYGQWLTYLMVLIPVGWLIFSWLRDRNNTQRLPVARQS
jgi:high-affinity iron transporter